MLDFTQPSSAGGKGDKLLLHKIPGFHCVCRSQMELQIRHRINTTQQRQAREENNNRIDGAACVSNATATKGTLCSNDWDGPQHLQWYGINSILVSKYSDDRSPLTSGSEGGSKELLKRAPKSYRSGFQKVKAEKLWYINCGGFGILVDFGTA